MSYLKDRAVLVGLQPQMPAALVGLVAPTLERGERVVFSFPVDMNLLGSYAQEWLVVTTARCAAWEELEEGFRERIAFRLADLRAVRLREMTGNHVLLVDRGKGWEEMVRSSNLTAWKLKPAVQVLQKVADSGLASVGDFSALDLKLPQRDVCPKCGRIIRPQLGFCVACMSTRQTLQRMLSLIVPHRYWALLGFSILMVVGLLRLVPPLITKEVVDLVLNPVTSGHAPAESYWYRFGDAGSVRLLVVLGAAMLAMIILPALLNALRFYITSWVGQRIVVDLSNRVFSHMMRLSLSFYHHEETGRVMARITQDVARVRQFIGSRVPALLYDILIIVLIVGILCWLNLRLAVMVLTPIPVLFTISLLARKKFHRLYHVLWRRYAAMSAFLADTIPGIRVVKAFAQGQREVGRFGQIMERVFVHEMKATKLHTMIDPVINMSAALGGLIALVAGSIMLIQGGGAPGTIEVGTIWAFSLYMGMFAGPVQDLASMLPDFEHAATSAERVFEVLDSEPELQSAQRTRIMPPIRGRVEFQNVSFGYEPEEMVLHDVSFVAEPGQMIGLVGHSGAGKTTVVNLLCHFYRVNEGKVLIDGIDLTDVEVESLRSQIGIVAQEPFLFSGTVAENIAYGRPDATESDIIAAAKAANAHEFILKFPEGYDTRVGERGLGVSGGERQRIAIARAILKDPRILILDEATSSVDTEAEEKIQDALRRLVRGRTTFAIAHRLSTLKYADQLIALKDGRIVERGTHDELIRLGGVYATLCQKQAALSHVGGWAE